MKLHICGICGTFMGGIALLARALGHQVSGSDANVYPPMSTQLMEAGIQLKEGYSADNIEEDTELVIVGNAMSRGNAEVEHILNNRIAYTSGPQWLSENVLTDRWVLAVAGTHGKTTTSSILAWLLEDAGLQPGFLIGGVANNFGVSARLGESPFFVIEADEYDTAFFDKRSKFVHYRPNTAILNNLEFDHADIFPDIDAIKRQFHHLVRIVPGNGKLIVNGVDSHLQDVLKQGCWSEVEQFYATLNAVTTHADWSLGDVSNEGFELTVPNRDVTFARWSMPGRHNASNAMAAVAAARHAGVAVDTALASLASFGGIKRRLEVRGCEAGVTVYDDFAHHPTAIRETLSAIHPRIGDGRLVAVVDMRSNSMRMGVHTAHLPESFELAHETVLHCPPEQHSEELQNVLSSTKVRVLADVNSIIDYLLNTLRNRDHLVIMSNGGFGDIHGQVLARLADK